MPEVDSRRARRAEGQRRFDEVAVAFLGRQDVSAAPMFGSSGLRLGDRFFAFVGRDGQLVVKLPPEQAADLVAGGVVSPVRAGRNVTRDWVAVPWREERGTEAWRRLAEDAYRYLGALRPSERAVRE